MALAMFVGCDNAPVIPSWPTGGLISQNVEMLEGQVIPSNAFNVYATYTDGAKTIKNVAVTEIGDSADGKADNGEALQYLVGLDYYGNEVYAKGQLSAYPVNRIEVTVAEGTTLVLDEAVAKPDLKVTAFYTNADGKEASKPVSTIDISNVTAVKADEDADMTAETVPATFTVTALGVDCTVDVTVATIPPEPVTEIESAAFVDGVEFAALDYTGTELPALDNAMVSVNDVNGAYVDGLELSFVNATTKLPLNEDLGQYNFISFKDIAVKVALNDTVEYLSVVPATATISVQVKNGIDALVIGSDVPAINPDDFVVTLNVAGNYTILDLESDSFNWYTNNAVYEGTTVQSRMAVQVSYMGILSNVAEVKTVQPEAETVVTAIEFTLKDGTVGPAKQIYTTAPVFDESNIESVTVTTKKGKEAPVTTKVPAPYDGFTFEYSTTEDSVTALKDGIQITEATDIYVVATYEDVTFGVSVETTKAVATDITLSAEYESAVASGITWTVATVNDDGIVAILSDGDYTIWSNGETTGITLPKNVEDKEQGPFVVTYGEFQSDPVTIAAGDGYVTPAEDGFKVELKAKALIGNPVSGNPEDYAVKKDSWTPTDTGVTPEPQVYSIRKAVSDQKYEETSTVYARVSYVDSTGETIITDEFAVTIEGVPYVEYENLSVVPVEGKIENGKILAGQLYNVDEFVINEASYTAHGNVKLEVESVAFGGKTYTSGQSIDTIVSTATGQVTVNIKPFINAAGEEVKGAAVELQVASSLD